MISRSVMSRVSYLCECLHNACSHNKVKVKSGRKNEEKLEIFPEIRAIGQED